MDKGSANWELESINVERIREDGFQIIDMEKYQSLLPFIEKQLITSPNNLDLLNKKIIILDILGRHEDALKYIEKVFQIDNKNYLGNVNKIMSLIGLRRYTDALKHLDEFLINYPLDNFILYTKAVVLEMLARHTDSLRFFFNSLNIDEEDYGEMLKVGSFIVNEYNATHFSGKILVQDSKYPLKIKLVDSTS